MLKGVGVTLALPWFESYLPAAEAAVGPLAAGGPPRRWCLLMMSNGVNIDDYWIKQNGSDLELGKTLKALEPHKQDLLFIDNLHIFDDTVGVHTPYFTNFLSGEKVRKGGVPDLAESLDQYMARTIGKATPVPTINLGVEGAGVGGGGGSPGVYNVTMSWSSRTTPVPPEVFPRQAFDRLFDISGLQRDKSVLDFLREQAGDLRRELNARDKDKLDEYLTSIREIEQRIEMATSEDRFTDWRPSLEEPNLDRPDDGKPNKVEEHMRIMLDIIVLAFQMDKTRVASMIFEKDVGGMTFEFLKGVSKTGIHSLSHHKRNEKVLEEYQIVNAFHIDLLNDMIEKMKSIDEGNGTTLFDNSMLLFGSTMRDGDRHDANDLPLILAGGSACGIKGGRHLTFDKLEDRRLCNLHLDLAQRMGVPGEDGKLIQQFGNSHYPLPGISG